jgi:hypothetical protein
VREFAEPLVAEALLDAVVGWPEWCHRRVDSIHPQVGERGRVRHSIDCTPPPDVRLAYLPDERDRRRIDDLQGPVIVPLAITAKGPMRQLDASVDGAPLPLLSLAENSALGVAMLEHALRGVPRVDPATAREALLGVVGPALPGRRAPEAVARELVDQGTFAGRPVWDPRDVDPEVAALMMDLSRGFLLCGLVPSEHAGTRRLLKLAFHWRIEKSTPSGGRLHERVACGLGWASRSIELPMTAPGYSASYHLEFQTPAELDCVRLELPADHGLQPGALDVSGQPVAHAHAAFPEPPAGSARVHLHVPARGIWLHAALSAFVTAVVMWLAIGLPGATATLMGRPDGAAALLLGIPAVLISLAAGRGENALSAWMLAPVRAFMLACSAGLVAVAASMVGHLHEPWRAVLWWVVAVAASVLLVAMLVPPVVRRALPAVGVSRYASSTDEGSVT